MTLSRQGYASESADSGADALHFLQKHTDSPVSLILTDLLMPELNGIEFIEQVQEIYPDIGMIVITGGNDLGQAVEAMKKGALDFINKPIQEDVFIPRIKKAIERVRLVKENRNYQKFLEEKVESRTIALLEKHRSLQQLYFNTVEAIVRAIEAKDPYTLGHSKRVSKYCKRIANKMCLGEAEAQDIMIAGLLHDVGKIGISDSVLTKPSRLTIEEFEHIKEHPVISYKIIEPIKELKKAKDYVKHHHEKWDGTGYPDGLKGKKIPLGARILSVADAFDTMWIGRHYHAPWDMETVIEEFKKNCGTQFDKKVVDAFIEIATKDQKDFDLIRKENPARINHPGGNPKK